MYSNHTTKFVNTLATLPVTDGNEWPTFQGPSFALAAISMSCMLSMWEFQQIEIERAALLWGKDCAKHTHSTPKVTKSKQAQRKDPYSCVDTHHLHSCSKWGVVIPYLEQTIDVACSGEVFETHRVVLHQQQKIRECDSFVKQGIEHRVSPRWVLRSHSALKRVSVWGCCLSRFSCTTYVIDDWNSNEQ